MRKNAANRELRSGLEWLGLRELTQYATVSARTLRTWIHSAVDPLPAVLRSGKILVNRRAFDAWLRVHTLKPANSDKRNGATVSATAVQR
jgi:hypothetical protein